jgi:hypothetical protein
MLEKKALDYFVHHAGSPDGVVEGGIAVFAAGNEYAPAASYPAAYPDYVSVAATAGDFTPAVYSNYGKGVTISAPGGDQDYYYDYGEQGCYFVPEKVNNHRCGEPSRCQLSMPFRSENYVAFFYYNISAYCHKQLLQYGATNRNKHKGKAYRKKN